ncbi:metallophosphoesterase [Nannocystaceae bacterium ST9]
MSDQRSSYSEDASAGILASLPELLHVNRPYAWWGEILARVSSTIDSIATPRAWITHLRDGQTTDIQQALSARMQSTGAVGRAPGKVLEVGLDTLPAGSDVWFIGDIHGDLLGLEAALAIIRERSGPGTKVVLLGDLVDDGFNCGEIILRVIDLILADPDLEISMLAGNHDEALLYDMDARVFKSRVEPGDFALWLNEHPAWHDVGRAFINFVSLLPRALFFRQGLFAAHAGFPHSDTWARIAHASGTARLQDADMLKDFTWNRLSEAKQKIPNRSTSGASFGSEDFHGFCEVVSGALGYDITMMVRGHDHISDRRERFSRPLSHRRWAYDGKILTVNNMSYALPRETGMDFGKIGLGRQPTLARWCVEQGSPKPIAIEIPADVLAQYVVVCETCGRARPRAGKRCWTRVDKGGLCGDSNAASPVQEREHEIDS